MGWLFLCHYEPRYCPSSQSFNPIKTFIFTTKIFIILSMVFKCKPFSLLSVHELYQVLRLRSEVFVVEQKCIFQDLDNKDQHCLHVLMVDVDLKAYARLVPPGMSYLEMSIGRVITDPAIRGTGAGKRLMKFAIEQCYHHYGKGPIKIGAQCYAAKFYGLFGFMQSGDVYDEDGIDHIEMILN